MFTPIFRVRPSVSSVRLDSQELFGSSGHIRTRDSESRRDLCWSLPSPALDVSVKQPSLRFFAATFTFEVSPSANGSFQTPWK